MYLEQAQLDWLQRHPITVNLLTSVVGFATGGLVVAVFFNWIRERDKARQLHEPVAQQWQEITREARRAFGLLSIDELSGLGRAKADAYSEFVVRLWNGDAMDPADWATHATKMRDELDALLGS